MALDPTGPTGRASVGRGGRSKEAEARKEYEGRFGGPERYAPGHEQELSLSDKAVLEDAIALALGRMLVRFASLERITRFTLCQLLDDLEENEVNALISELPFRKVRSVLLALVEQRFPKSAVEDQLRDVMKRIQRLEERRNALVHSSWVHSDLPQAMTREKLKVSEKGYFRVHEERFEDVEALDQFVAEINRTAQEVVEIWIHEGLGVRPIIQESDE